MRLAHIPARGGSKRIPRKNILPFCGRPMMSWVIETAARSGCFDRIVVSTDDPEVAEVAVQSGAEVPFLRPAVLSDDHTGLIDVIRHTIGVLLPEPGSEDWVCNILATAALLKPEDLRSSWALIEARQDVDFALAVTAFPAPIQRALRLDDRSRVSMFDPEQFPKRSQDLEPAYHDAGQFCWGRARAWCSVSNVFTPACLAMRIPAHRAQDIDTPEDWSRAEWIFKSMRTLEAAS
jgi:pseudaminic acid cytidylyltransferase